jgi:hypothetical protein
MDEIKINRFGTRSVKDGWQVVISNDNAKMTGRQLAVVAVAEVNSLREAREIAGILNNALEGFTVVEEMRKP